MKKGRTELSERLVQRARELHEQDAFAPAETGVGTRIGIEDVSRALADDRRSSRKTVVVFAVLLAVVALLSLPLNYYAGGDPSVLTPQQLLDCYTLFFQANILPLFDPTAAARVEALKLSFGNGNLYDAAMLRVALTGLTILCGFLLAASGMLFQSAFRNPLAAPSMLGVSDGVSLGYIIYVFLGFTQIQDTPEVFTLCIYGCGAATLVLVLLVSRFLSGGKTYNVMDMLLVGTVVAQLVSGIVTYITNFGIDLETWYKFYELQQSLDTPSYAVTYIACGIVAVVSLVPVIVLRFRLNLISFSDEEGRMLGARPALLRGVALACGALMQLAALASIGQVAMVGLAVPFLCRFLFAADFRHQLLGNFLVGSTALLVCQWVAHFVVIDGFAMPVGTVVGVVIMPFFVWMMALQRKGWGDD